MSICLSTEVKRAMGYVSTGMGDCFSALVVSLMALRHVLVDRKPFRPCYLTGLNFNVYMNFMWSLWAHHKCKYIQLNPAYHSPSSFQPSKNLFPILPQLHDCWESNDRPYLTCIDISLHESTVPCLLGTPQQSDSEILWLSYTHFWNTAEYLLGVHIYM